MLDSPALPRAQTRQATGVWHNGPAYVVSGISAATVGLMLFFQNRGFNLLDESNLWQLVADPEASRRAGDVYLFGFVLHPLYVLVGGDILRYRILGLTFTVTLATLLACEVLRFVLQGSRSASRRDPLLSLSYPWRTALVTCMAAMSTLAFVYNNRVLSYNSLTVNGLVLGAMGMLLLARGLQWRGSAVIALGLWLTFAGKPSSAAGLVLVGLVVAAYQRLPLRRCLSIGLVVALGSLALALLTVRMWPWETVSFLERGLARARLRGHASPWTLLGWTPQDWSALLTLGTAVGALSILCLLILCRWTNAARADRVLCAFVPVVVALTVVDHTVFSRSLAASSSGDRMRSLTLLIPLLGAAALLLSRRNGPEGLAAQRDRPAAAVAGALAVLPYVYALGSSTEFSLVMSHAALFWMAALTVMTRLWAPAVLQLMTLVCCCLTALLVSTSLVDGPPGESLLAATQPSSVNDSTLLMPPTDSAVMLQLEATRLRHGLSHDIPVVDLTGIAPGYALQLGGRSLGGGFFMGIFEGADEAAAYGLSFESCSDLATAWLLVADDNPADVSKAYTQEGVDLGRDYDEITSFRPTQGPKEWRRLEVRVLRPKPSVSSVMGCS